MKSTRLVAAAVVVVLLAAAHSAVNAQAPVARSGDHWVGAWATAVVARQQTQRPGQGEAPQGAAQASERQAQGQGQRAAVHFNNQTIRQIVRLTLGGEKLRVVVSNVWGTAPLELGGAHVGLHAKESAIAPNSDRALTFSGNPTITIPAGAVVVSDPVALTLPPFADLAVDLYLPGDTSASESPLTTQGAGGQTNYVSPAGNHAGASDMPVATTTNAWFFLARVEVAAPEQVGAVVGIGDSITAGSRATLNNRWLDVLARRLAAANIKMGVMNVGIGGNQLLFDRNGNQSGSARFDRDVLMQAGVTHVIIYQGVNDIRHEEHVRVADLIAGQRQLIDRARSRGLRVLGALLTPFEGSEYTPEKEAKRQALNTWIRTSKLYDGVIDFDQAVRDPSRPTQLSPKFDSGDHIHPNDAGYEAMGNAIDLQLFKMAPRAAIAAR
jgi:lysophospholipase L1-like esterase